MLSGSITYVVVILWGVWVLRGDRIERERPMKVLFSLLFAFYVSRLLAVTLFPLPIDSAVIEQGRALGDSGFGPGNNFVPFRTVNDALGSEFSFVNQVIGNFLLLLPLGLMAPLLFERFSRKVSAIALVIGTTVAIEVTQLGVSTLLGYTYRSFDVDDLWLNAAGGVLGVLFASWVMHLQDAGDAVESNADDSALEVPVVTDSLESVPCRSALG